MFPNFIARNPYVTSFFTPQNAGLPIDPVAAALAGGSIGSLIATPSFNQNRAASQLSATQAWSVLLNTANQAGLQLLDQSKAGQFEQRTVTSSATSITGTVQPQATQQSYTVNVQQLAQGQQISSNSFAAAGTNFAAGTYTIQLTAGKNTQAAQVTNVTFTVSAGQNNQTVFNNLAAAINNGNTGTTAAVNVSGTNVTLGVTNNTTGNGGSLAIANVTGNFVTQATLSNSTQAAQNALYTVNGVGYNNFGNTAVLDNGNLSLTLSGTTATPATVTVGQNSNNLSNAVTNFVTAYNNAVSYANTNGSNLPTGLIAGLTHVASRYQVDMQNIGLTYNNDGTISVNSTTLNNSIAANPYQVEQLFNAPLQGAPTGQYRQKNQLPGGGLAADFVSYAAGAINSSLQDRQSSLQATNFYYQQQQQKLMKAAGGATITSQIGQYLNNLILPTSVYSTFA
jgi:flagellar hook-associated protein 2